VGRSDQLDRAGLALLGRAGHRAGQAGEASFYLYFPHLDSAERVAGRLRHDAFAVTIQHGARGNDWLVLARKAMFPEAEIEAVRPRLEALAKGEGSEYDGWEVEIPAGR